MFLARSVELAIFDQHAKTDGQRYRMIDVCPGLISRRSWITSEWRTSANWVGLRTQVGFSVIRSATRSCSNDSNYPPAEPEALRLLGKRLGNTPFRREACVW